MFELNGKNVVITGALGLLGSEFVRACLHAGSAVMALDVRRDEDRMDRFRKVSDRVYFYNCDVTSYDSVKECVHAIVKEHDRIDVLVNNAYPRGKNFGKKFEDVALEDWNDNVNLLLGSCFNITKQVVLEMIKKRAGNIINIGSIYGVVAPRFSIYEGTKMTMPSEYAAAKGGLINFTRYLAACLSGYNIRANAISPGGIFDNQDPKFVEQYVKNVPLGRMGKPDDVSGVVVFLASDVSKYITGQNIIVDGGWTCC